MFNLFKKKYSFVVVGPGKIAEKHCKILLTMGHKIASVYSPNSIKNDFFRKFNFINNLEYLKNIQFDFGLITSPNKYHKNQIEEFLKLNKPVFVEKPVMISSNDFQYIKKKFPNNYSIIFGGFNLRYQKNTNFIKDIKNKKIQSIRVKWIKDFKPENNWSLNLDISGGGILIDWGIHAIDLLNYLLDEDINIIDIKFNNFDNKIEKSIDLNLKTKSNIIINFKMSWFLSDEFVSSPLQIEFKGLDESYIWQKSGEIFLIKDNIKSKSYNSNSLMIYDYFIKYYLKKNINKIIEGEKLKNFTSYHKVATLIDNLYKLKS